MSGIGLSGDARHLSEEELVRRGRDAVKRGRFEEAGEALFEYCGRLERQGRPISPVILANYALCLGQASRVREGLEISRLLAAGRARHPEVSLCLAKLYLLAGLKRPAVEAVDQGLALSPHNGELCRLREELGLRRAPPLPFLPRGNAVNVRL
ncbi:MAG: tetratricopeptide repeat protein, partial [Thermoanaerobaculia bacterium]